jgi:hypothetical protein
LLRTQSAGSAGKEETSLMPLPLSSAGIAGLRKAARDRLDGVATRTRAKLEQAKPLATSAEIDAATAAWLAEITPDALITTDPADIVALAQLAAPHAADAEQLAKVTELANGAAAGHNGPESEIHLRASDVLFLCDLAAPSTAQPDHLEPHA